MFPDQIFGFVRIDFTVNAEIEFARDAGGKNLLWIRPIDSLSAQPLPGTDDASYPFWSPDSRTIGYSTRGKLMKIAASETPRPILR